MKSFFAFLFAVQYMIDTKVRMCVVDGDGCICILRAKENPLVPYNNNIIKLIKYFDKKSFS